MTGKFWLVAELLLLSIGGLTMQACFEGPAPYAPYGYSSACADAQRVQNTYWRDRNTGHPAAAAELKSENEWAFRGPCSGGYEWPLVSAVPYTAYGPYGVYSYGDYDRDHHWHNSDWWVDHDRNWVQQHHPNWITPSKRHDSERGHDHDQGHGQNYGHDNH
jgi:hypothetical protein